MGDTALWKGFRFGMLLQLAVGPVCLTVFRTAAEHGFFAGVSVAAAAALVDAFYLSLSCMGAAAMLKKEKVQAAAKIAGCIILVLFGANTVLGVWGLSLLPSVPLFSGVSGGGLFVQGLILTASNPLTILFWGGVFSARTAGEGWGGRQLFSFAGGCVAATGFFLSFVSLLGSTLQSFLPKEIIVALNLGVGAALIFFGVRLLVQKKKAESPSV